MKECKKCKLVKEQNEFTKDKQKIDGFYSYCKKCVSERNACIREEKKEQIKKYSDEYRQKNREILREKSRKFFMENKEKCLEKGRKSYNLHKEEIAKRRKKIRNNEMERHKENLRQKEWRKKNPSLFRSYIKNWQQKNREKHASHQKVHRAVEKGTLIRAEHCEKCGLISKTEGHHEDYSKPLEVKWLCRRCHAKIIETIEV